MTTALGLADDYGWRREQDLDRLREEAVAHREHEIGAVHAEALRDHEKRALTYQQGLNAGFVGPPTTTGISVTQFTAFQISAWWNGINVIAGDIGVLDRHLYRRVGDDDRERVTGAHPVAKLLEQPNEYMVPLVFWQTLMAHVLGWGNAYAEIEFDNALRPIALWPITPDQIEPVVDVTVGKNGATKTKLWYRYRGQYRLEAEDVLHIPGLGFDGVRGYSVVTLARQSLSLTLAIERFGGAFFGNNAVAGMVLEHPRTLTKEAQERIRASVEEMHQGTERAFRLFIAEEGMKLGHHQTTVNPDEAQAKETRDFQISEVARWLRLPPHKLGHQMGARPGGNLETSEIGYHTGTLLPWTTLIDQLCNRKLVSRAQQGAYYVEHNYSRRLQTDMVTRMQAYKALYEMHVVDADYIARKENLPKPKPIPQPAAPAAAPADEPVALPASATRVGLATAQRRALTAVVSRYSRREAENAKRAAKKGPKAFGDWVESYYSEDEGAVLRESLEAVLALCAESSGHARDCAAIAERYATRHQARSKSELLSVRAKEVGAAVPSLLKRWETARVVEGVEELMAALVAAEEEADVA